MRDEAAFLSAIRDDPDDDAIRLIFADWLEERGDPRGTFIRGQVQLARLPQRDPLAPTLQAQEHDLLVQHGRDWIGPLPECTRGWRSRGLFQVVAEAPMLVENLPRLASQLAWIEKLTLLFVDAGHLEDLGEVPNFSSLSRLDLRNNRFGDAGAGVLGEAKVFAGVGWLDLSLCGLGDSGILQLAFSPHRQRLRALHLAFNSIGPAGAASLAQSPHVAGLKVLDLCYNRIGDQGAEHLAASPNLTALDALYLSGNQIHREGALALARSKAFPRLTALHMSGNELTPASRGNLVRRFGEGVRC